MNKPILLAVMTIFPMASISQNVEAVFVQGHGSGQAGGWELTAQQLAVANAWLGGRKPNCLAGLGSPPVPAIRVELVRPDGGKVGLGFYDQPRYAGVVETRVGKNLCHFEAGDTAVSALHQAIKELK